ncbi:hypothetical protein GJ700_27800 [Duganella sp. FT92W]|uniref:RelA/SpoT domain-containing protein n=1 Tax=Pseudoduganella rivuli TaxID=2666085 RepID=A0A7X2LW14_9BURK|nr:hypothetical protein [Pseudoduganella rivuli]MRV75528.1 hypothetical protein [Pseudoduganella rivuli]
MTTGNHSNQQKFDFLQHEQSTITSYLKVYNFWSELTIANKRIIEESIKKRSIQIHSVEGRAKSPTSLAKKAITPSDHDPSKPKYLQPLKEITDLSAVRIITFFPKTIELIDALLKEEFEILEFSDKSKNLLEDEKFGYQSVHYLVKLNSTRSGLSEYERFSGAITEIQVRTILQHAWAEIEHDIQYKSSTTIPTDIRRRFMALAGLLEIADREFQAIQDDDQELTIRAESLVNTGKLSEVEITPSALKTYLNRKLGADGRMSDFSYDWTVRLLKKLGFKNFQQIENCISGYDADQISRILEGKRQGQLTRFEYLLLTAMGERYIERHHFAGQNWYGKLPRKQLKMLEDASIKIGNFDPLSIEEEINTPLNPG